MVFRRCTQQCTTMCAALKKGTSETSEKNTFTRDVISVPSLCHGAQLIAHTFDSKPLRPRKPFAAWEVGHSIRKVSTHSLGRDHIHPGPKEPWLFPNSQEGCEGGMICGWCDVLIYALGFKCLELHSELNKTRLLSATMNTKLLIFVMCSTGTHTIGLGLL